MSERPPTDGSDPLSGPVEGGEDGTFRDFADMVPLMMWRADGDSRTARVNEAWRAFTGGGTADWLDGLHPEDSRGRETAFREAFADQKAFSVEYRMRRHDGAWRWLLDTGRPVVREGRFAGYVGSCIDITDRHVHEAEAEAALAEKEALLAEIYHRVRNNLQIMVSLIGLYGRAAPDTCRPAFDALGQRVRAIALVQQHLHETTHIAAIDLRDYLQRLATGLGQLHRTGRVSVMVRAEATEVVEPRIANALGMVVAEVVSECLDASADTTTCPITIETARAGDTLAVRVHAPPPDEAGDRRSAPTLGPRLIAAYAAQAGIGIEGRPGSGEPLVLTLPRPGEAE